MLWLFLVDRIVFDKTFDYIQRVAVDFRYSFLVIL